MTSSSAVSRSAPTILIIDAEGPFRGQVSIAFEDEGFEVDVASDKTLGGHMLAARRPDLVVLDPSVPGVDGHAFLEHIQQILTDAPPVVLLSSVPTLESALRGLKLGAFSFLPKPVELRKLVETCRSALERAEAEFQAGLRDERRTHTRRPILVEVHVVRESDRGVLEDLVGSDTGNRYVIGEMIDMSAGGARIISVAEFPIGTRVDVTPNPKVVASSVTLTGVVRWSKAVETGHMYGLQFVDLDAELERLLGSILGSS